MDRLPQWIVTWLCLVAWRVRKVYQYKVLHDHTRTAALLKESKWLALSYNLCSFKITGILSMSFDIYWFFTLLFHRNRFARAFTLSSSAHLADQKENTIRGELMAVCNDCRGLVLEIIRSSRQTRSSARNRALKNLTLDLSPVYKRW